MGLGLGLRTDKKRGPPSPRAGTGQGNIETVHEPEPIQAERIPWGQGRRAMRDPYGPGTQVREGVRAIKVSMSCSSVQEELMYRRVVRTDQKQCLGRRGVGVRRRRGYHGDAFEPARSYFSTHSQIFLPYSSI